MKQRGIAAFPPKPRKFISKPQKHSRSNLGKPLGVPTNLQQSGAPKSCWKIKARLVNPSKENTARPNQTTVLGSITCPAACHPTPPSITFPLQPFRDAVPAGKVSASQTHCFLFIK